MVVARLCCDPVVSGTTSYHRKRVVGPVGLKQCFSYSPLTSSPQRVECAAIQNHSKKGWMYRLHRQTNFLEKRTFRYLLGSRIKEWAVCSALFGVRF